MDDFDEIEDIISEAFIALWKSREKIPSDIHLRNFLYTVVRHRAVEDRIASRLQCKAETNEVKGKLAALFTAIER